MLVLNGTVSGAIVPLGESAGEEGGWELANEWQFAGCLGGKRAMDREWPSTNRPGALRLYDPRSVISLTLLILFHTLSHCRCVFLYHFLSISVTLSPSSFSRRLCSLTVSVTVLLPTCICLCRCLRTSLCLSA